MPRPHNPDGSVDSILARVRSLRHRTQRDRTSLFFIEGIRPFVQACDAGFEFDTILLSPILLQSPLADMLARRQVARGVRRVRLSPEQFRQISTAERASGIAAIVRQRWTPLASADPDRGLAWLLVEHLRSPGNLGTILRTAEATGVAGVILLSDGLDPYDPGTLRASMAGVFHLRLVRASHHRAALWADEQHVTVVGLSPDASLIWTELPPLQRVALLIGGERAGLSAQGRALCSLQVRLPMTGRADSLNVATATGVVLYELMRRRAVV